MTFPCLGNESDTGPGNQPMQHFQQQIACGEFNRVFNLINVTIKMKKQI